MSAIEGTFYSVNENGDFVVQVEDLIQESRRKLEEATEGFWKNHEMTFCRSISKIPCYPCKKRSTCKNPAGDREDFVSQVVRKVFDSDGNHFDSFDYNKYYPMVLAHVKANILKIVEQTEVQGLFQPHVLQKEGWDLAEAI